MALATVYLHHGPLRRLAGRVRMALRLNPNFSLALGYYGLVLSGVGRWQEGADAAHRAMRLEPARPLLRRSSTVSSPMPSSSAGTTRRRCGWPARRSGSAPNSSAVTGSLRPPRPWRATWSSHGPRCRSCAGPSPTSPWPGSRPSCPGSTRPIGSIIWKAFVAPGWNRAVPTSAATMTAACHGGVVLTGIGCSVANP